MERALSLLLVTCLIASPLAGCTATGPRRIGTVRSGGGMPREGNQWSRVARLARGSTITVTLKGGQPASRNFVAADESELIALNLTDATLPRQVTRMLRAQASDHPYDWWFTLSHGQTFTQGRVRLGPDGVFLDGRRVAALGQVLETFARGDVFEITGPVVARGSVGGVLLGGWLGFAGGFTLAEGYGVVWAAYPSLALGIYLGSHIGSHATEGLVYRAQ